MLKKNTEGIFLKIETKVAVKVLLSKHGREGNLDPTFSESGFEAEIGTMKSRLILSRLSKSSKDRLRF